MTTQLIDIDGQRLTIRRGTSPTHVFQVYEQGTTTPKNLVGATETTLAIGFDQNTVVRDLMLTLGNGVTHNGAGGLISVSFTTVQTEALPVGLRWAELWITDSSGRRDLSGAGPAIITDSMITVP